MPRKTMLPEPNPIIIASLTKIELDSMLSFQSCLMLASIQQEQSTRIPSMCATSDAPSFFMHAAELLKIVAASDVCELAGFEPRVSEARL